MNIPENQPVKEYAFRGQAQIPFEGIREEDTLAVPTFGNQAVHACEKADEASPCASCPATETYRLKARAAKTEYLCGYRCISHVERKKQTQEARKVNSVFSKDSKLHRNAIAMKGHKIQSQETSKPILFEGDGR